MNPKSKPDADEQDVHEHQPKYQFVGFGGYGKDRRMLAISSHYFDTVFEVLGLKKKPKHRSEGEG